MIIRWLHFWYRSNAFIFCVFLLENHRDEMSNTNMQGRFGFSNNCIWRKEGKSYVFLRPSSKLDKKLDKKIVKPSSNPAAQLQNHLALSNTKFLEIIAPRFQYKYDKKTSGLFAGKPAKNCQEIVFRNCKRYRNNIIFIQKVKSKWQQRHKNVCQIFFQKQHTQSTVN